jgi:exopolyphosphatase/guanosine-5'-triphosphate,3'-diphosphate pyrophosphatase
VHKTLAEYRCALDEHGVERTVAVLTSAVRDAENGAELTDAVRERYGLDARTISGDEEAQLMFAGATSERSDPDGTAVLVIDIGGGSTEFVAGSGREVSFHVSTQAGVVRQTERHLHADPPDAGELRALREEVAAIVRDGVPDEVRRAAAAGIAVAGTATSCAAMAQDLEPYDPDRVHGYLLDRATTEGLLERLRAMSVAERRHVRGLHPDRAPTIVAGVAILLEAMSAFRLAAVEVSEHDILRGAALAAGGELPAAGGSITPNR